MAELANPTPRTDDIAEKGPELEAMVQRILQLAQEMGATAADADVSLSAGLSVTARLGDVETLEYQRDRGVGVTVYFGKNKGSADSADFSDAALRETVAKACNIAKFTSADEHSGLADKDRMATDLFDLDLYHPWDISAEAAVDLAKEIEAAARDYDARIVNSDGASVTARRGIHVYGNSHGFVGSQLGSSSSISCSVLAQAPDDDAMTTDYWYSSARDFKELESATAVGEKAGKATVERLGARVIPTCECPVIFRADIARSLFGHFVSAVSGGSLYRKASFLLDSLGQPIFADHINIVERPHLPKAMASACFDGEGVATTNKDVVTNGVLNTYFLGSYSARQMGMETTGSAGGIRNLIVAPGDQDLAALLKQMGTGLLVTETMGHGVNGVTGDYSQGASGFWVENGQLAYPVHEITVAGNLAEMYQQIVAIGSDVDLRGNVRTGSVLIEKMMVAGE